jgi:hypothetical protein
MIAARDLTASSTRTLPPGILNCETSAGSAIDEVDSVSTRSRSRRMRCERSRWRMYWCATERDWDVALDRSEVDELDA